jgi:hypothetical protein
VKDLRHESVSDLLRQYKDVLAELKSRKVVRTNNAPLGDLAEKCAIYVYGGDLEPNSNAFFDLKTPNGERVQVKCRQRSRTTSLSRRFSGIRSLDFEWCVFLLVDGDAVIRASEWSPDDIRTCGTWQETRRAWSVTVGQFLKNENVGTDRTDDFRNAWWRLLNSTAVDFEIDDDEADLQGLQIRWAHRYNAYGRLAREPHELEMILQPALDQYRRNHTVPEWCGIDLLRGWAFYLVRADRFAGGGTLGREFQDVLATVSRHPEKESGDLPPGFRTT